MANTDTNKINTNLEDLSADECTALEIIARYICSDRLNYALDSGLSRDQYDFAKLALESRGLIRRNGAITLAGRGAIATT